MCEGMDREKH